MLSQDRRVQLRLDKVKDIPINNEKPSADEAQLKKQRFWLIFKIFLEQVFIKI